MSIDEKLLMDLAGQIGLRGNSAEAAKKAGQQAEQYKNRSEKELLDEIMNLRASMKSNPQMYQKQIKAIRSLRSIMTGEQRARLDKLIQLLEQE